MQVWAGSKQKQLEAGSMQLMHQYVPLAAGMLAVLVPLFEPLGLTGRDSGGHEVRLFAPFPVDK